MKDKSVDWILRICWTKDVICWNIRIYENIKDNFDGGTMSNIGYMIKKRVIWRLGIIGRIHNFFLAYQLGGY